MGLLDRIAATRQESRSSIDMWIDQYLLPANQFTYNGTTYPFGLNTTWTQSRQKEIANSLPGYLGALRGCPPAFAAQMVRAVVLSQARFTFRNLPSSPTARRMFGTRALGLLEKPWPKATTGQLISRMEWHAGLAGNAYVYRQPDRLRVLRPDWVSILFGSQREPDDPLHALDGEVIGYVYQNGGMANPTGKPQTLLPDEVAHWSPQPDPERAEIGMSWITPALRDIQADQAATEHKIQFFAHGATPNLVVKGIPAATQEQFDDIVDKLEERHAGVANAYRTLYLTAGADATVVGANLSEINIGGVQGASETRISFLSRVPAALLGIQDGMKGSSLNAGNYAETRRTFSDSWIYPTLQDLCAALSPMVTVPSDAELWFDPADMPILREDSKDAAQIEQVKSITITTYVKEGFTPESAIAAVRGQDITLLKHSGLVSVQLQPPGTTPPDALPGADAAPKVPTLRAEERRFNPDEPRRPDGKWGSGGVVKDALKLADRINLGQDERLVGSAKVGDGRGDYSTVMAGIDGPDGPRIRFGVVDTYEGTKKWRASNGGATVVLDRHATGELRRVVAEAQVKGPKSVADYRADIKARHARGEPDSEWPSPEADIARGVIRGSAWGDIEWTLTREEGPDYTVGGVNLGPGGKWLLSLDVKAADNKLGPLDSFDIYSPSVAQKLDGALADLMGMPADQGRAAGHDTTPGHDELHHYWVYGEGLAKWAGSPKPWTTLVALLTPHVGPEKAKTYASRWFFQHFGFYAGSDKNRVLHGKPPRGKRIGPG